MSIKTHKGSLKECGRILYTNVRLVLRLVVVSFSNFCKKLHGTLSMSSVVLSVNCNKSQ
ncbi:hypothetical protein C0J52_12337 [Blattella germanica]|nr:hypothetical protein C0J52_12337 [Blattella germanica]